METTDYNKQATDFLEKHGLTFRAVHKGDKCPIFCDGSCNHGDRHIVTIRRKRDGQRVSFDFWNSISDVESGSELRAYSVLACISGDVHCPETFEEFCREFGYSEDSRQAEKTFKACSKFSSKLRSFFSESEIEELGEIR